MGPKRYQRYGRLGFSVFHDFLPNLIEIVKLFPREVEEFAPFVGVDVWIGIIWASSKGQISRVSGDVHLQTFGTLVVASRWIIAEPRTRD